MSKLPLKNKYDRVIIGKYGTGECVVDVYRVLDAFTSGSSELDHAVKKCLAPGDRGHKDLRQDLIDIRDSAQAALDLHIDKYGFIFTH
jgi:hypothetical protein